MTPSFRLPLAITHSDSALPMTPPELDSPQRSATRAAIDATVRMQFDDTLDVVEGRCYNISIGGMFLDSDAVRPAGSLVRFELLLEEGNSVRGLGEVVWAQDAAIPGRRSGLGLKFRFLEQRDRQAIFKLVSQHIKEKLAQRPPMAGEPPVPDTPLARSRRASLLGEGLPAPEPPPAPVLMPPEPAAPPAEPFRAPGERPSRSIPVISEGAPIPPPQPLGRAFDKKADRPLEERTWQMPALSGGTARSNRPADPSWLDDRAGFETDGGGPRQALPLRPDVEDDWDDRPLGTAAAPEPHHYLDDTDPAHFEHRPRTKPVPWGLVLGTAGVLLVLALLYFFFFRSAAGKPPEVIRIGNGGQGGETASLPPAEPPPRPEPVRDEPRQPEPAPAVPREAEPTLAETGLPAPSPLPPSAAVPDREPSAPRAAEPRAEPPAPKPAAAKEFERVVGISHRRAQGGVEIVIEGDGEIPQSRTSKMRLEGREVLSLYGVAKRFDTKEIAVGDSWVKGLRIGYHAGGARGNEIRLVIDLASPSAKVARITSQGRNLIVLVTTD